MILIKALLLYLLAFGQSVASEAVLAEIAARLAKSPITQGEFRQQKQIKVLHKPLISTGTFTYDQNKGVIWKTLTPVA
ncbi:MAG: outer membrane lipoprotein carrier protein LolA, partial [Methylobacter sp.]